MLAWGWHPTLALYWLKCIMPMLQTDVEPIFHQRWLNRNKKKYFWQIGYLQLKKNGPESLNNCEKIRGNLLLQLLRLLQRCWQNISNIGKALANLPTFCQPCQRMANIGPILHVCWVSLCYGMSDKESVSFTLFRDPYKFFL